LQPGADGIIISADIAGTVAPMTEGDPGVTSEKNSHHTLVNRDTTTRRARRLAVRSEVGELGFVLSSFRNRETEPAFNSPGTMRAVVGV